MSLGWVGGWVVTYYQGDDEEDRVCFEEHPLHCFALPTRFLLPSLGGEGGGGLGFPLRIQLGL